jgi:hypothetical protein
MDTLSTRDTEMYTRCLTLTRKAVRTRFRLASTSPLGRVALPSEEGIK